MLPLDREQSFQHIRRLLSSASRVVIAAPYFGIGAFDELLGEEFKGTLSVYCDLFSGGCNPAEIKKFLKASPNVRSVGTLHAKVYWCDKGVVIGSANPSSNGLAFEGTEVEGLIEACVLSEDAHVIEQWEKFITTKVYPFSKEIKEADIKLAAKLWKDRRNHRRRITNETLLATMSSNPEFFADKDIVLITYAESDLSPGAKKLFRAEEAGRQIAALDAYEEWNVRPGTRVTGRQNVRYECGSCRSSQRAF
jgi:phosphatidylserine/phosphatidylglycerophosphate/cardiolipin synthase-like enzyme